MDMSLDNINVKSSLNILGFSNNRIVGSNKSKAKLSIFDKIKRFYFSKKYERALNKISKLEEEKAPLADNIEEKTNEMLDVAIEKDKSEEVNALAKEIEKDTAKVEKIDEKLEREREKAIDSAKKIDEIDNSVVQPEEQIDNVDTSIDEEKVDEQLEEVQEQISDDVNAIKENEEQPKEEKKSKNVVDIVLEEMTAQLMKDNRPIIVALMKELENKYNERLDKYSAKVEEKTNSIVDGFNKTIEARDKKIDSLKKNMVDMQGKYQQHIQTLESTHEQDMNNIKTDLEHTKSELARTNDMNERYFETIEDQKKQIEDRNQQIASLQSDNTSKDEEIASMQKEIERLRVFEQSVNMLRGVMGTAVATPQEPQVEVQQVEETGKTL